MTNGVRNANERCERAREESAVWKISLPGRAADLGPVFGHSRRKIQMHMLKRWARARNADIATLTFKVTNCTCTVLYTRNDAGLIVNLFLDGMYKLKLAYLPLFFLYNLSPS